MAQGDPFLHHIKYEREKLLEILQLKKYQALLADGLPGCQHCAHVRVLVCVGRMMSLINNNNCCVFKIEISSS